MRFDYPEAMVQLAVLLGARFGAGATARTLDVPLSSIYRWLARDRRAADSGDAIENSRLLGLLDECQARGFDVAERVRVLTATTHVACAETPRTIVQTNERAAVTPPEDVPCAERGLRSAQMRRARNLIATRYFEQASTETLAQQFQMSKFHFIKTFKREMGVSPYQYLLTVRIAQAKRLLESTPHSLHAVATAVGFDSVSSLCKTFKSLEGTTIARFFASRRLQTGRGAAPYEADVAEIALI